VVWFGAERRCCGAGAGLVSCWIEMLQWRWFCLVQSGDVLGMRFGLVQGGDAVMGKVVWFGAG
jgi:hypothetical protein